MCKHPLIIRLPNGWVCRFCGFGSLSDSGGTHLIIDDMVWTKTVDSGSSRWPPTGADDIGHGASIAVFP